MFLAPNGTTVLVGLAALCLLALLAILLLRHRLRRGAERSSTAREHHHLVFAYRSPVHAFALCTALAASILTINWTQPNHAHRVEGYQIEPLEMIDVDIPITLPPAPPPPPPLPMEITPLPDEIVEESPDFEDRSVEVEDEVVADLAPPVPDAAPAPAPPPPPPPPPPKTPVEPVLFAEKMPTFGEDCMNLSGDERRICSDLALLTFVQSRITYPPMARENGIQGTVIVTFVVDTKGQVTALEALRGVGGGCTEEALRAMRSINEEGRRFSPGIQNEQFVPVKFTMPIQFKLY